jgi:cholinesterase
MAREAWSNLSVDCLIGGVSNEGLIMGYFLNVEKDLSALDMLKNSKYFAPLLETGFSCDDPRSVEFGKILKQAYYGCTQPSKSNIEGYFYFAGDYFFWHGIQRATMLRAKHSKAKTFLYRFDVLTKLNYFKNFAQCDIYPGTEHGADFCYLFKGTFMSPPAVDSIEFENVKKTVDIFTSFAINGDPNCNWTNDEWNSINSAELPLKAMNIGTETSEFIDLPETERLKVWNKIFEDSGVELF